jgi:hypothetical protein
MDETQEPGGQLSPSRGVFATARRRAVRRDVILIRSSTRWIEFRSDMSLANTTASDGCVRSDVRAVSIIVDRSVLLRSNRFVLAKRLSLTVAATPRAAVPSSDVPRAGAQREELEEPVRTLRRVL